MRKLFAIYMCLLVIVVSIALLLTLPAAVIAAYVEQGFSELFIFLSIITILIEPLTICCSYVLLTSIKDIYNDSLI